MRKKSADELEYIIADAAEAAGCMVNVDPRAEAKYLGQVEQASSELHRRHGVKESKTHEGGLKAGDTVAFSKAVIKRLGYCATTAAMRGVVLGLNGKVARVDTKGSWANEEGNPVRFIPVANLVKVSVQACTFF